MKKVIIQVCLFTLVFNIVPLYAQDESNILKNKKEINNIYRVGVDDILKINVFQPEEIITTVTVSPDGYFFFPYIGNIQGKGNTLSEIQKNITRKLSNGYMKYPIVSITLEASRSRKFYVFGEVIKPGMYLLKEKVDVLKAIAMAGGFTKYGSMSRIKLLRSNDEFGFKQIKINLKAIITGDSKENYLLEPEDILFISEGFF